MHYPLKFYLSTKATRLALFLILLPLVGCSQQTSDSSAGDDSSKSTPAEAPNAGTIGGPIFIPSAPGTFEIKRVGYDSGTAFKLRSKEPISRVDILVTFEPPQDSDQRQELVKTTLENDVNMYRGQPELEFSNEIVPIKTEFDLDSKISSDFVLKLSSPEMPNHNQMLVRTLVFFDKHFFHVRIQADSEDTLAELTNWASNIQYFDEPD